VTSQNALRVLVVDDDPDACRNLSDILGDVGYHVEYAHGGRAALELLTQGRYDVALLDFKMPEMDGLALCRKIKEQSAGTVPLLVTAHAGAAIDQEAPAAGVLKVFAKPLDARKLLKTLDQLTKKDEGAQSSPS
jgi:two-component system alkaline phosphatase synthesis response regulator PhoP